jgi:AraC-like DNA-binding protein
MFADDHLTLRMVRVKGGEKWEPADQGLCFLFVRGGSGKLVVGPVNQRIAVGDVVVLRSDAGARIVVATPGELAFSCFSASVEHMFPLFSVNEISLLQNVTENIKGLKFLPSGSPLAMECQRLAANVPPQFNLDHRSYLLHIAAVVLGDEFKSQHLQRHRAGFVSMDDHLLQVFERLSSHDLLSLSAGELAAKFGCSRRHLNRLFHQHFGFSVAALRMEMRMIKAVSLLRESAAKIINVAERCGFNHLGLFNTCFKRRFGTSPGQWRAMMAQKPATAVAGHRQESHCPLESNGFCPMLANPGISGPAITHRNQLKSAALSAVLAESVKPKTTNGAQNPALKLPAAIGSEPAKPLTARAGA